MTVKTFYLYFRCFFQDHFFLLRRLGFVGNDENLAKVTLALLGNPHIHTHTSLGVAVKLRQLGLQTELRQGPRREPSSSPAPVAAAQNRSFVSAWSRETQIICCRARGSSMDRNCRPRPALYDVMKSTDDCKPSSDAPTRH